jgi:predicted component of type VI protein secretion system
MEERLQSSASIQENHVVAVDGTKRRFLQRTVQPIRSSKSGGSAQDNQQALPKPALHPQYSEEERARHAKLFQDKAAIEKQVQEQLQQMQQLGLQPGHAPSSRVLAAASTPALHAATRGKPALLSRAALNPLHALAAVPLASVAVSRTSTASRGASPAPSHTRPQSCSTRSSVSRLSAGNLWKSSDSAVSGSRSSAQHSEVDSQIGFLEETLAREKLRRMAAESELAYLKEIVLSTRQQLSRPLV